MEDEEKERNWDERRGRKRNTGKGDGRRRDDKKCENSDPRDQRREERFGRRTREKALTDADLFCVG
jgi:hypothetical protein